MHDSRNGHPSWPPPSSTDILLGAIHRDLREIRMEQRETREDLGGLKAGMRRSLSNDMEIFTRLREMGERVTTVEVRQAQSGLPLSAAPDSRTGLTGLILALTDLMPPLKDVLEILAALAVLATGVGLAVDRAQSVPTPSISAPAP